MHMKHVNLILPIEILRNAAFPDAAATLDWFQCRDHPTRSGIEQVVAARLAKYAGNNKEREANAQADVLAEPVATISTFPNSW